jgi:hypothetical protein
MSPSSFKINMRRYIPEAERRAILAAHGHRGAQDRWDGIDSLAPEQQAAVERCIALASVSPLPGRVGRIGGELWGIRFNEHVRGGTAYAFAELDVAPAGIVHWGFNGGLFGYCLARGDMPRGSRAQAECGSAPHTAVAVTLPKPSKITVEQSGDGTWELTVRFSRRLWATDQAWPSKQEARAAAEALVRALANAGAHK